MALALPAASPEDPDRGECLLEPAVYRYLAHVQDRILAQWELPADGMANREVVLRLVFAASGWPSDAKIISTSDTRLARSASLAIVRAAPFGPVPAEAACLVGLPIRTTLRNPAGD